MPYCADNMCTCVLERRALRPLHVFRVDRRDATHVRPVMHVMHVMPQGATTVSPFATSQTLPSEVRIYVEATSPSAIKWFSQSQKGDNTTTMFPFLGKSTGKIIPKLASLHRRKSCQSEVVIALFHLPLFGVTLELHSSIHDHRPFNLKGTRLTRTI